jgi:hypothetical protein
MSEPDSDCPLEKVWWWVRFLVFVKLACLSLAGHLTRRGAWALAAGAALVAGGVVTVALGDRVFGDPAHFTAERWRAGSLEQRGRMAADLCASGVLRGKTREEVRDLLGEPDRDFADAIEYDVRSPHPASPRPEWVAVRFDRRSGRVAEVKIEE